MNSDLQFLRNTYCRRHRRLHREVQELQVDQEVQGIQVRGILLDPWVQCYQVVRGIQVDPGLRVVQVLRASLQKDKMVYMHRFGQFSSDIYALVKHIGLHIIPSSK